MKVLIKLTALLLPLLCIQYSYSVPKNLRLVGVGDMTKEMTLVFEGDSTANAKVYYDVINYGDNLSNYSFSKAVDESHLVVSMQAQIIRLKNLQPDTRYYFIIKDDTGASRVHYFETLPNNSQPLSIIAGGCSIENRSIRIAANKMVAKLLPHAVLFAGDFTDIGSYTQWDNWFTDWTYSFTPDGRITPIIPARGNHESNNNFLNMLFGVSQSGYHRTRLNDLLSVYTLNSEDYVTNYSTQTFWLDQKMATEGSRFKIVQYHKSIRPHTTLKLEGDVQYCFWPKIFEKYNVDLVIETDATTLKQTWPIVSCTGGLNCEMGFRRDDDNGIVYVGEGGWGSPIKDANDVKSWTRDAWSANQFKWIFVKPDKMEVRTVIYDNVVLINPLNYSNRFSIPQNMMLWSPSNGDVIEIKHDDTSKPKLSNQLPYIDQTFVYLNPINLSVEASDLNGTVDKVSFYINNTLVNTDFTAPFEFNGWTPSNFGSYQLTTLATNDQGKTKTLKTIFQIVEPHQIGQTQIKNITNDAEELSNGDMDLFNWDLDFGYNGYTLGLRFTNLNIPPEAIVTNAYLQLTSDEIKTISTTLKIKAENSVDSAPFKLETKNISSRATTQNSVEWKTEQWFSVGENGIKQRSPNLANILNEIIGLNNYSFSSPISLIITGTGHRAGESVDGDRSNAPVLHYEYYIKNSSDCATDMIIDPNTDLNSVPLYCRSITTTGNLTIGQSSNYLLRASNSLQFNHGFEISTNSSFFADIEPCE